MSKLLYKGLHGLLAILKPLINTNNERNNNIQLEYRPADAGKAKQ